MWKTSRILFIILILVVFVRNTPVDWTQSATWSGTCQSGMKQSPIDINTKEAQFCPDELHMKIEAPCTDFYYEEQGQCLSVDVSDLSYVSLKKIDWDNMEGKFGYYKAVKLDYHSPSEHRINGEEFDLEVQVYHEYAEEITQMREGNMKYPYEMNGTGTDGMYVQIMNSSMLNGSGLDRAQSNESYYQFEPFKSDIHKVVVSILFKEDPNAEGDAFDTFWQNQNISNLRKTFECIADKFFWAYEGSETMPPCTEDVQWFIVREALPIRPENLQKMKAKLNGGQPNNRPVQARLYPEVSLVSDEDCDYLISKRRMKEIEKMQEEERKSQYIPED